MDPLLQLQRAEQDFYQRQMSHLQSGTGINPPMNFADTAWRNLIEPTLGGAFDLFAAPGRIANGTISSEPHPAYGGYEQYNEPGRLTMGDALNAADFAMPGPEMGGLLLTPQALRRVLPQQGGSAAMPPWTYYGGREVDPFEQLGVFEAGGDPYATGWYRNRGAPENSPPRWEIPTKSIGVGHIYDQLPGGQYPFTPYVRSPEGTIPPEVADLQRYLTENVGYMGDPGLEGRLGQYNSDLMSPPNYGMGGTISVTGEGGGNTLTHETQHAMQALGFGGDIPVMEGSFGSHFKTFQDLSQGNLDPREFQRMLISEVEEIGGDKVFAMGPRSSAIYQMMNNPEYFRHVVDSNLGLADKAINRLMYTRDWSEAEARNAARRSQFPALHGLAPWETSDIPDSWVHWPR